MPRRIRAALGVRLGPSRDVQSLDQGDEQSGVGRAVEVGTDLAEPLRLAQTLLDALLECTQPGLDDAASLFVVG